MSPVHTDSARDDCELGLLQRENLRTLTTKSRYERRGAHEKGRSVIRTTLATLSSAQIAAAFNTVYAGYFMPFDVDAGWVEQLPARNSIDFAHSPV